MSVLTTSAILLRSYPYSETSQILRFYSESLGVLGAMARGIRKTGGRKGGAPSTFSEGLLDIHFKENRDLQTFREFSSTRPRRGLASDPIRLAGASVLGELILQHAEGEGNPQLFRGLGLGLDAMEHVGMDSFQPTLLMHLWSLIKELGFGPSVQACVDCGRPFQGGELGRFDFSSGGLRCSSCPGESHGPRLGPLARDQLRSLLSGEVPPELIRPRTHLRLASDFITYHISGGTPLRSMAVLVSLTPESDA